MKKIIVIALLVILIDALFNATLAAIAIIENNYILPVHEQTPIKNFIGALFFYSTMYILYAVPIYVLLIVAYISMLRLVKPTMSKSITLAATLAVGCYLICEYALSTESSFNYFYLKAIWYAIAGALFGWLYFHYVLSPKNR
ncbi:hypothetical protein [Dyadobacter sp. 676]|uniref:DUF2177 family protein n=1 Tax=Dyadobacter sp. 676 TaxID=3088362 RepID=A0AAU8FJU3_9BACT